MVERVWVLGAGFSMPLGGPALRDLFSGSSELALKKHFPDKEKLREKAATRARQLHAKKSGWSNAEEFLDRLDSAATRGPDSPQWQVLTSLLSNDKTPLTEIATASRRLLAAECSYFLNHADPETEQWSPYRRWANLLTANDAIITFNYDRVLEKLHEREDPKRKAFLSIKPTPAAVDFCEGCQVLKLHGSVDWRRSDDGKVEVSDDPHFALSAAGGELAIATTGPTKENVTSRLFDPLWRRAEHLIREANYIFFIGYRFPPTDSIARERLLHAMLKNSTVKGDRGGVFAVLGPETNGKDAKRLDALLRFSCRSYKDE